MSSRPGVPQLSPEKGLASSTIGNALMAASQLAIEKLVEGDCWISVPKESDEMSKISAERSRSPSAFVSSLTRFLSNPFSGVGQMPNCSYRSKKLELVGGDFKLILVDLDLGSRTAADPLRWIGVTFGRFGVEKLGVAGEDAVGAGPNEGIEMRLGVVSVLVLGPLKAGAEPLEHEESTRSGVEAGDRREILVIVGK